MQLVELAFTEKEAVKDKNFSTVFSLLARPHFGNSSLEHSVDFRGKDGKFGREGTVQGQAYKTANNLSRKC